MLHSFYNSIVTSMKGPRKVSPLNTGSASASPPEPGDLSSSSSSSESESDTDDAGSCVEKPLTSINLHVSDLSVASNKVDSQVVVSRGRVLRKGGSVASSQSTMSTVSIRSTDSSVKTSLSEPAEKPAHSVRRTPGASSPIGGSNATKGHAFVAADIHKSTSLPVLSISSERNSGTDAVKSPKARGAGAVTPTSANRPPRPQKANTGLTHMQEELLHHGSMMPLSKNVTVMHLQLTVDDKTAEEIQAHTPLHTRQTHFTANGIRPNTVQLDEPHAHSSQRHKGASSPAHAGPAREEGLCPEGGHRIMRSEVPDDLVDSIESLVDAKMSRHGPHFAQQTIHSLISAAALVHHPK